MLSCVGVAPIAEVRTVDSLNERAYDMRYRDLEVSFRLAKQAYAHVRHYHDGRAEAMSQMAFYHFMKLQFSEAERLYQSVYEQSDNDLELLIADVGLMKIYQRQAEYQKYYMYYNRAVERMRRIEAEKSAFSDPHVRSRLIYARSEFFIVSAIYYYYLRQAPEAESAFRQVRLDDIQKDHSQWLYYHYLRSACSLYEGWAPEEEELEKFDDLMICLRLAIRDNYPYFIGNAWQGLSELLADPHQADFYARLRPNSFAGLGIPNDSLLSLTMAQRSLKIFKQYGDDYQIASAYTTISEYYNRHGLYQVALDTLNRAMTYATPDRNVPEWLSSIHEQMSIAYSGLGMKAESDRHRNAYLDILQNTRQDREAQSRILVLQEEAAVLKVMLIGVVSGALLVVLLFWLFNRWSRVRYHRQIEQLKLTLDICRKVTASIPPHATDEQEIKDAITAAIVPDLKQLDNEKLRTVIQPYIEWTINNGITFLQLGDEQSTLEKQRYIFEQHIARNKRENLIKKACLAIVNGIVPFIDRILHETRKLKATPHVGQTDFRMERYQYIDELVTTINEYNDILALWIKLKQGSIGLSIENFALNELFELLLKGRKTFEMKQQTLTVEPTEAVVKADKALTLFMINTLTDNARKFTPEGGHIKVAASVTENYVEIAVEDNGIGLSAEDMHKIEGEKLYDSAQIGTSGQETKTEELQKGSGFGLLNCKGIIEKYRKSNPIFLVCKFGVQSEKGRGSRFYFRLPTGVRKQIGVWLIFALTTGLSVSAHPPYADSYATKQDSIVVGMYKDSTYQCNLNGQYGQALQYADSVFQHLNRYYLAHGGQPDLLLTMSGKEGVPAECVWWNNMVDMSYDVILFVRNEVVLANLALKQWDAYTYNNNAYEQLFKLYSEDHSWEDYITELERSTGSRKVALALSIMLLGVLLFGYYFLYIRKRWHNRWQLEQVLEINRIVFASSHMHTEQTIEALQREENTLQSIPQRIVGEVFAAVNELMEVSHLGIAVYNEAVRQLEFADYDVADERIVEWVQHCYDTQEVIRHSGFQAFPLHVDVAGVTTCVGVFYLRHREQEQETDRLLLQIVAQFIGIVIFNSVVKLATRYRDIESAYEDTHRASWEDSLLHVQNMVLDNCLSTIKHETIYYPNRIKQILTRLQTELIGTPEEATAVEAIAELIEYYKGVFTLLSSCASRQLEEVTFRRSVVAVPVLLAYAEKYFHRRAEAVGVVSDIQFVVEMEQKDNANALQVVGDSNQLNYLFENLIDEALSHRISGLLELTVNVEGAFVGFRFTDRRREYTVEELNGLFYPNLARMTGEQEGNLCGTEFLLCKQIIRDHDEYVGRRGCRIYAEQTAGNGFTICFTIPKR